MKSWLLRWITKLCLQLSFCINRFVGVSFSFSKWGDGLTLIFFLCVDMTDIVGRLENGNSHSLTYLFNSLQVLNSSHWWCNYFSLCQPFIPSLYLPEAEPFKKCTAEQLQQCVECQREFHRATRDVIQHNSSFSEVPYLVFIYNPIHFHGIAFWR